MAAAYDSRGRAYKQKRELDKAIADYTAAIKLEPKAIDFLNDRGIAYYAARQNDKAIADYNQIIRIQPRYVYAYNNRGQLLPGHGRQEAGDRRLHQGHAA